MLCFLIRITVRFIIPNIKKNTDSEYAKAVSQLKNGIFLELRAEYNDIQRDIYPMLFEDVFARADQEMYLNKQKMKSALTE